MRWLTLDDAEAGRAGVAELQDFVADARIVVLGEELHGDGQTFRAKARLARLLLEDFGFDTMGWESPVWDVHQMNGVPEEADDDAFAAQGLFAVWHGKEINPLIRFCRERGIEHAGVDCQVIDAPGLATAIAGWCADSAIEISTEVLEAFLTGENDLAEETLRSLRGRVRSDGRTWAELVIENVLSNRDQERLGEAVYGPYREAKARGEVIELDPFDPVLIQANSLRDEVMGANAARLVDEGRRVVLWAANYHAVRSLGRSHPYAEHAPFVRTMGDVLHRRLGSQARVVVGTSLGGTRWDFDRWDEVPTHRRDGIEQTWPSHPSPQLGLLDQQDDFDGAVHLVGIGGMHLDRPMDHFDAVLHVARQSPPTYTRW